MKLKLREPLKSLASKKYTVGLNGLAEFEMFSEPHVAAGDNIQIDAYEPGENSSKEADWRYCHKLCIGDGRILVEMIG